jgi:transposase, IS5 family
MKPREALETGQNDMFRSRLDQIIDMGHPKAVLARQIDWRHMAGRFGECYSLEPGHPALPTRLMAGLQILKYTENLSDEVLCDRFGAMPENG